MKSFRRIGRFTSRVVNEKKTKAAISSQNSIESQQHRFMYTLHFTCVCRVFLCYSRTQCTRSITKCVKTMHASYHVLQLNYTSYSDLLFLLLQVMLLLLLPQPQSSLLALFVFINFLLAICFAPHKLESKDYPNWMNDQYLCVEMVASLLLDSLHSIAIKYLQCCEYRDNNEVMLDNSDNGCWLCSCAHYSLWKNIILTSTGATVLVCRCNMRQCLHRLWYI